MGVLVVIEGPPGIGKSRLCAEAASLAIGGGMTALAARGGELEHDVTYGIARQLFERLLHDHDAPTRRTLLAGPARLALPAIGKWPQDLDSSADAGIDHGLYWLVANLADRQPLALIIDDAHWADRPSLRALLYLARRLEGLPVAVVLAARFGEPGSEPELVRLLEAEPVAHRLQPAPLSESGSIELVSRRLGRPLPASAAGACHEMSGGNPFFLGELAGALVGAGEQSERSLIAEIRLFAPPAVSLSILLRVGRLGQVVRTVTEALAVVGDGAAFELLRAVTELDEESVGDAIEKLAEAAITSRSGAVAFLHPIIRTVIYEDLPSVLRGRLHARAARWLITVCAPVEQIAHHLVLTEPTGDHVAVGQLMTAAERAIARGAHDAAVPLLLRALGERPKSDVRREVLTVLGEAELRNGDLVGAAAHLREALELGPRPALGVRAALALSSALIAAGSSVGAFEVLEQQAARLEGDHALRLDVERATIGMWVRSTTAVPWLPGLLAAFARLPGETPVQRLGLTQAALDAAYQPGSGCVHARELARRSLAEELLSTERSVDAIGVGMACYVLVLCEDFGRAEHLTAAMLRDAQRRGSALGFVAASQLSGSISLARGELLTAAANSEAAWAAALTVADSPMAQRSIAFAQAWLVESLLARGDLDAARAAVQRGATAGDFDRPELVWARYGRGLLRLRCDGDPAGAAEDLLAVGEAARAGGYEDRGAPWRLWAALALAADRRGEQALVLADEQLRIAETWGAVGGLGMSLRVRALVGDAADAEQLLARAVEVLADSYCRLEHARAAVEYGRALRRAGRRTAARGSLERGLELAARCGARPLIEEARSELHVLGSRPRRLMFSGVDGLTATERRVAAMAASGLSNRDIAQSLFVTTKTVENHLGSVFRKLGVKTRRDLPSDLAPLN